MTVLEQYFLLLVGAVLGSVVGLIVIAAVEAIRRALRHRRRRAPIWTVDTTMEIPAPRRRPR